MRDIKFRGLAKHGWVYGDLINGLDTAKPFVKIKRTLGVDNDDCLSYDIENPETIGQYTGLNDINGVDIYEGDIVKFKSFHDDSYWIRKVTYAGCAFYADYRLEDLVNAPTVFTVKIIGNIHENPELLNKEKQ